LQYLIITAGQPVFSLGFLGVLLGSFPWWCVTTSLVGSDPLFDGGEGLLDLLGGFAERDNCRRLFFGRSNLGLALRHGRFRQQTGLGDLDDIAILVGLLGAGNVAV
jgi:hypothetical protein